MQPDVRYKSNIKLITTVISIIVVAGVVLLADHLKAKKINTVSSSSQIASVPVSQPTATIDNSPSASSNNSSPATTSTYKDGTYNASSDYYVPHGNENIKVSLTLKNGVITNTSITNSEGNDDSARFQEDFASVYKQYVVGKSITGLKLGAISGASDTVQGFNDAVNQIITKAQA